MDADSNSTFISNFNKTDMKDKLTEQVDTDLLDFHAKLICCYNVFYKKDFKEEIYDLKEQAITKEGG